MADTGKRSGTAWAVAAVTFGPLFAALLLYFTGVWSPRGSTAHGELYAVGNRLPAIELIEDGGRTTDEAAPWRLVHVSGSDCADACRSALISTRQVRLSLGPDMKRVRRLLLVTPEMSPAAELLRSHPDIATGILGKTQENGSGSDFYEREQDRIIVVDPLGNLVLRYGQDVAMDDLQTDLKRLLKLSRIG